MSYLCAQASNAEKASESSFRQVSTMLPGAPGFNDLQQLSLAHAAKGSKEEVFVREVANIGEILPLKIEARQLQSINKRHYVVPVRMVVEYLAEFYPHKLLPSPALGDVEKILTDFWASFKVLHPNHPVYEKYNGTLKNCIPMKIHSDEGTGLRKSAVLQVSWGPVLTQTGNSLDRYFFWTCMNAEDYKAYNKGYAAGNEVLDELAEMLAGETTSLFETGVKCKGMTFYLCWVALEICRRKPELSIANVILGAFLMQCVTGAWQMTTTTLLQILPGQPCGALRCRPHHLGLEVLRAHS